MTIISCQLPGCDWESPDVSDAVAIALLQNHSIAHNQQSNQAATAAQIEKVRRPTVSYGGTTEDWSVFMTLWNEYVDATQISGKVATIQLLECCEVQLRKDLIRVTGGSLSGKPVNDVLAAIKQLAVRQENTMVARVNLHNMRQDRDEPIRAFNARVRGQADVCKFIIECQSCKCEVNYADEVIRDVITKGLADPDIQRDILGHIDQNMSLTNVINFIEAKEDGKLSTSRFLGAHAAEAPTTAAAARSQYRAEKKRPPQNQQHASQEDCFYCGQTGHGRRASLKDRRAFCKAFGHTCKRCNKPNHFEDVCNCKKQENQAKAITTEPSDVLCSIFDSPSSAKTSQDSNDIAALKHHVFKKSTGRWAEQRSQSQPLVDVEIAVAEYSDLGVGHSQPHDTVTISQRALADTGCQSCLVGVEIIKRLNLTPEDLIRSTTGMNAADNHPIQIIGALPLLITAQSENGESITSKQLTYVTDKLGDVMYLSREACTDLGIINEEFPKVGQQITCAGIPHETCSCPTRQPPPPKPTLPFPATEGNRQKLEEFLLNHYTSSTFNTCPHQPLPLMEGPPIHLMIDEKAQPVAYHSPIPVPLHWQKEVKKSLDQDVRLGVLEEVPIGEPVTWCHRMVVCAKKDGRPRRTVDLQALNRHAVRETHHTPSPFLQARSILRNTKKLSMMHGMATIASQSARRTAI